MESGAPVPHVVAVPFLFTQGHISAVMNFCLKLAEKGLQVTIVEIQVGELTSKLKLPALENMTLKSLDLPLPQFDNKSPATRYTEIMRILYEDLQAPFEQLLSTLPPVCCIVCDRMYAWTQDSARKLGISRISIWTASASAMSVDFYVPQLLEEGNIPVNSNLFVFHSSGVLNLFADSNKDKLVTCIPGMKTLKGADIPFIYHADNIMTTTDPGYARKIARSIILKDDAWLVVNTFDELEPDVIKAAKMHINKRCVTLGPLISKKSDSNAGRECLPWLDSKPPGSVVYVAFGSAVVFSKSDFDELVRGLEQSGFSYLWVLRPASVKETDIEEFKERSIGAGCLVVDWAPQVEVLSHAAVAAFITHCGWNSVLDSVTGGVPLIGFPQSAEQNLNLKLVEDAGAGTRLLMGEVGSVIRSVLGNVEMKEKASMLKHAALSAEPGNEARLDEIVQDIWRMHGALR